MRPLCPHEIFFYGTPLSCSPHPDPDQFQVPCEYADGALCRQLYEQIVDARDRLCERFGIDPDDRDLDIILSSYEEINQIFGIKMYQYGKKGIL